MFSFVNVCLCCAIMICDAMHSVSLDAELVSNWYIVELGRKMEVALCLKLLKVFHLAGSDIMSPVLYK